MSAGITLITSQKVFDETIASLDWHDAFIKESIFVAGIWFRAGGVASGDGDVLRILFVLPCQFPNSALEVIAYGVKQYQLASFLDDHSPIAEIRRRDAHLNLGTFVSVHASCFAYRWLDNRFAGFETCYSALPIHNELGELLYPFNIDWRTAMDLVSDLS